MDPRAAFLEVAGGSFAATRTGLTVLASGALAVLIVSLLASPAMQGLVGMPGPSTAKEPSRVAPVRAPQQVRPELTPRQIAIARRATATIASQEVGVREWGNGSNHGRRIVQYRRAVTGHGENPRSREPWCADFVSWVWRSAGVPIGFGSQGSDYVPELVLWARLTGRWHAAGSGYKPLRGDLIVYRVGEDRKGHIGLVVRRNGARISTIEGNYRDRVSRRSVRLASRNITGFIAPV